MDGGSVIFFGDTTLPIIPSLAQLLEARRPNSLLSQFLSLSEEVLRESIGHLPGHVQEEALRFTRLSDIVDSEHHELPALHVLAPAILVIVQLGHFIGWYENPSHCEFPSTSKSLCIGLCVGQLSAAAVSLAKNVVELIPIAVDTVRLAVRLGSLVFTVGGDLEVEEHQDPWALLIEKEVLPDTDLASILDKWDKSSRKQPYITAEFDSTVTVQGPPTTLISLKGIILEFLKSTQSARAGRPLPIFAPYHAPHLYTELDVENLVKGLTSFSKAPGLNNERTAGPALLSPYLAHAVDRERPAEIVRDVLKDLLFRPIQWKNLIEGTASYLTSLKLSEFDIYCFGPVHSHKSFISTIQDKIDAKVMLCDTTVQGDQEHSTRGLNIPIAVIGISGRFPDANSVDELWRILADGVDCHRVIPNDRFDPSIYVSKDGKDKNKSATEFGNFMKDPGQFDARFFNMSPREAMQTDPQQRLALVTAYEALELAGYVPGQTPSTQMERIGSFYGQTTDDYKDVNVVQDIDTYYVSGVIRAFGPGRVSRANQLGGPSLSVDTACASSATALNLACTSIWSNECDTAVVGGMMLLNSPDMYAGLSRGHFVSSDGPCKTFDDEADGYCRGETVASIVLKRLDAAKADNDNVLGVILAAGTNYSAYAASITQPHAGTQESLFRKVLREAAVKPKDIDYVELHGTGTQLGDSTEMASVLNVLAPSHSRRPPDRPLYVGSVKANIGHGESASGITALIKALLLFKNSQIPPHIGIKSGRINRNFPPLEERNVKIAKKLTAFPPSPDRKRKVLINNFGAAGGNSSFVLEEGDSFSQESEPVTTVRDHVISVTAKSTTSLLRNLMNLVLFIENQPQVAMRDIAYSTTARKVQHPLRVSIVASTLSEAKSKLSAKVNNEGTRSTIKLSNPIFVFTGQGSLFANVGKQIFETNSSFRTHLTRLERIAVEHGFPPFIDAIINGSEEIGTLQPVQSQVGQVALQMSLFTLWSSWNIRPSAVIGHSLGEYAALFAAGVLSASDTLYLVGRRATLLQNLCESSTHGMLAVNQSLDRVKSVLADHFNGLEASCFNTPTDIVISGPIARIHEAQPLLKAHDMRCTLLNVPFAFHSSQVDPILGPLESEASKVSFRMPRIPILSTLLGRKLNNLDALNPSYLVRHAREPVQFAEAIQSAQLDNLITSESAFLEIGPHPVCLSMVASTLQSTSRLLSTLHRKEPPIATICKALATFSDGGISINWKNYHSSFAGTPKLLSLPTYAFDEKNYWIEYRNNWLLQRHPSSSPSKVNELQPQITTTVQRILSSTIDGSVASVVFESDLANPVLHGLIAGHIIHGIALCPSGVFVDIAMTVADYLRRNFSFNGPVSGIKVINLQMTKPVIMPVERPKTPRIFRICSQAYTQTGSIRLEIGTPAESGQELETHASCEIEFEDSALWLRQWNKNSYLILERILNLEDGVTRGSSSRMSHDMVYNLFSMVVHYDQRYQGMKEVIIDAEKLEAVVSLSLHNDPDMGTFFFSPLWLDNLAQIAGFVMNAIGKVDPREFTYISHGIGSYQIGEEIRPDLLYKAHVRMLPETGTVFSGDVSIFQGERLIARCGEVKFQRVPRAVLNKILSYPAEPRTSTRKLTAPDLTGGAQKGNHNLPLRRETHTHSIIDDVKELLAEQIGISAKDLTDKSGFQELGVDSLLSMTILAQIHEVLHIQLPASTFTDFSTFGSLKQYILKNLPDQSDGSATPVSESSESVVSSTSSRSQSLPSTPPDSRLTEVYSIIADEMGLDMEELLAAESLSSLGLDSMMAITITGALNERIGIEVPSGIFDSSSAKDLHSSLNDLFGSPRFDPQRDIQNAQQRVTPRRSLPASMTLQGDSHSTSKTLFLFPDGSGLATSYAKLPRISKELQVIGLNSCLLGEKSAIPRDISLIASKMVETVRQIQPSGPYLLAGWSAGGMYSFEAARQLLEAGESVASLILIDSPCRLRFGPMPPQLLHLLSDGLTLRSEVRQNFLDTIAAVDGYTPHPLKKNSLMRVTIIWAEDGLEKTMELQPGPIDLNYNDAIVEWLLRRAGPLDAMGWDKLLPDCSLEIRTTNGNHFSMVQTPNAKSLSDAISGALELS